ncbi:MAG: AAA family ATPase, partial [Lachnospiraceae bacterium]|nr:AAA family ATPase [Lachnospiraceae bacterium]
MLSRNVEKIIKNWLLNKKEALLVTGARQIGKTFTIRECLKTTSTDYLEINLIERPELIPVFDNISNTDDMILRLSVVSNKKLIPGKTVIFIDEVQELKEIVTRIKFLVEDGRFRYILSGSLLGVELKDIKSVPVGYMDVIDMYPLNIREFYTNLGLSEDIFSNIKMCYEEEKPVDNYIHDKLIKTFYLYLIVGGMPETVNSYLETNDLA